ncbi:MAG: hypothetical protein ACYDD2_15255 [Candidatus Acidiferrales bacterium]
MSIIKKPATPPEIVTLEVRIEQPLIAMLDRYGEFIGSTRDHIVTSAVRLVFKKDYEFKRWLREQLGTQKPRRTSEAQNDAPGKTVKA